MQPLARMGAWACSRCGRLERDPQPPLVCRGCGASRLYFTAPPAEGERPAGERPSPIERD